MFERHLLAFYNRFRHIHDDLALFDRTINLHEQFLIGSFLTFQGKHDSFVQEQDHIRFVLKCLAENSSPIRNMKQYLLASLYNAPTTMQLSYQNQTNHDLAMRR